MFPYDGYSKLAIGLAKSQDEASLRSAVSRAYYALMHKSRIFAEKRGQQFKYKKTAEIHREVINYFNNKNDASSTSLAIKLGRLKTTRNECDYDDHIQNIKKTTENAMINFEDAFGLLS